jgi:hypothetical protein
MHEILSADFRDAVNGCPRLNYRLRQATAALLDLEYRMAPLWRLTRWRDEEAAPEDDPDER